MRTLVVSDLHLGTHARRSVLRRQRPLELLLQALDDVDRLVLLGDAVELLEKRPEDALAVAEPVLRALGRHLGPGREIVYVPGNHDFDVVRAWLSGRAAGLQRDTLVPHDATPLLQRITSWLAPARVTVRYPGVWVADGVYALHGHYLNHHVFPRQAYGMVLRRVGDAVLPQAYDDVPEVWLTRTEPPLARILPRRLAALLEDVADTARAALMPGPQPPWHARWVAPLMSLLLRAQVRRTALPAMGQVIDRLGVRAGTVIFGHVHRLGPLPGDDPAQWLSPDGSTRLMNTGSWLYEHVLAHGAQRPHPYWPGGAILVEDGEPPRAVGLLDAVDPADLH